jgi:DNA excision repair protein ERCC-8
MLVSIQVKMCVNCVGAVSHAHTGLVNGLCYSTDGLHLITSGTDDAVRLWSTVSGAMLPVNYGQVPNDGARCRMVAYCGHTRPDLIFVPADNTILVFDVFSGDLVGTLRGHYNEVTCCLYNAYTQHVYSGATDHSIVVWVPQRDNVTAGLMTDDTPAGQPGPGQKSRANLMADSWSDDEA